MTNDRMDFGEAYSLAERLIDYLNNPPQEAA
jgi:hypothetical protein